MSGTAGTQGECRVEKETEEEIIQRCISHLDTDLLDTNRISANCICVSSFSYLNFLKKSPIFFWFMIFPPNKTINFTMEF